jgi:hypothetical protein
MRSVIGGHQQEKWFVSRKEKDCSLAGAFLQKLIIEHPETSLICTSSFFRD